MGCLLGGWNPSCRHPKVIHTPRCHQQGLPIPIWQTIMGGGGVAKVNYKNTLLSNGFPWNLEDFE